MKRNDLIRNKLFDNYSTNLQLVVEAMNGRIKFLNEQGEFVLPKDIFICPICSNLFTKESLNRNSLTPITLEHVPPEKLGGKPLTLTCKDCNCKVGGAKLDSKLVWNFEIEPFMKGELNTTIEAYYEINTRTRAKGRLTRIEKNKFGISFNPGTNPNLPEELDYLINNWEETKIRFTFQAPDKKMVLIALLKAAYLIMFSVFGYRYFFNPSAQIIRQQILEPHKELIPEFRIPLIDNLPADKKGIHFITSPQELRSFLVIFDITIADREKTLAVLMPGPNESDLMLYSKCKEMNRVNFRMFPIPPVDYLTDKRNLFAYNEMWSDIED